MLNLGGAVLRLCLRALLTGAGPEQEGGVAGEAGVLCERDNCSLLGSISGGECQPTQTLHLDIQDPAGFRGVVL